MPQPNCGKPASSAPTAPVYDTPGAGKPSGEVHFGVPGGKGTKGK